jgi:hypothetical protein
MTTTFAPIGSMAGLIAPAWSTARSEPAGDLANMRESIRKHLLRSYVIGNATVQALAELEEVRSQASEEGWDGYGALPVNRLACSFAEVFLNALPTTAPRPEVSAGSEGEVALDWLFGERKALTVSVGPTGRCTFAWILGESKIRGTEWIEDEIPASIVFALGQLARNAKTKSAD